MTRNVSNVLPQPQHPITDDAETKTQKSVDWASLALGSALAVAMVAGGIFLWNDWSAVRKGTVRLRRQRRPGVTQATHLDDALVDEAEATQLDPAVVEAAALLGVPLEASAQEVRAAFRARMASDGVHPDRGGDEATARRLIEARALVLAHLSHMEASK